MLGSGLCLGHGSGETKTASTTAAGPSRTCVVGVGAAVVKTRQQDKATLGVGAGGLDLEGCGAPVTEIENCLGCATDHVGRVIPLPVLVWSAAMGSDDEN